MIMQCPNCSNTVPDTANVCGYCGTRLRSPAPAPPPTTQPVPVSSALPAKSTFLQIGLFRASLIGFAILGLVIIGIVLFNFLESGRETIATPTQYVKPANPGQDTSALTIEPYENSDYPPFSSFVTNFSDSFDVSKRNSPGSFTWFMEVQRTQPVQIYLYNCAATMEILNGIYPHISYTLVVDERTVNIDNLFFVKADPAQGEFCHILVGLIREWPGPQHTIVIKMRLDQMINDGWMNHSAGDYIDIFQVTVTP